MTTFQTGFAAGPMVLAPLSEINGRKPVLLGTYALFNGEHFNIASIISAWGA
jgi:MFS family permease